jgi:hypothetical protein
MKRLRQTSPNANSSAGDEDRIGVVTNLSPMFVLFVTLAAKTFRIPLSLAAFVYFMTLFDARPSIALDFIGMNIRGAIDPGPIPIVVVNDDGVRIPYHPDPKLTAPPTKKPGLGRA